jgi:peptidoglycan/LPS O-acetylase OafA/YrhL
MDGAGVDGPAILAACRRAVGTRARAALFAATLLLGAVSAAGVAVSSSPANRTFATVSATAQSVMSVLVPLFGILLAGDVRRKRRHAVVPAALGVAALAAVVGLVGVALCAGATALSASDATSDPWRGAASVVAGSLLTQVIAGLVGTGLGLLLRPPAVAFAGTIVLPLGLWLLLGAVDAWHTAQAWLTPYASARNLLSGEMTPVRWAQSVVVLLLWGVVPIALGAAALRRRGSPAPAPPHPG